MAFLPVVSLNSLTPDLVHIIAYHLATSPLLGPPSNLISLLATSRRLYSLLNHHSNPHLYAQIFRSKFDVAAIQRRFPSLVTARALSDELARRWRSLSRVRKWASIKDQSSWSKSRYRIKELREDLMVIYLLLVESDGYNALQLLRWANVQDYLINYKDYRLAPEHADPEMPGETEEKSLFMWISWLLLDYSSLLTCKYGPTGSWQWLTTSYTIGTFAYQGFYASWPHFNLPSPPSNTRSSRSSSLLSQSTSPDLSLLSPLEIADNSLKPRPLCSSLRNYLGLPLKISQPILSQAATLLHIVRYSQRPSYNPAVPLLTDEQLLENARRQGGAISASTLWNELDIHSSTPSKTPYAPDHLQVNFNSLLDSRKHDDDWHRLISCRDPHLPSPRRAIPSSRPYRFTPGSLAGEWDGRFMIVDMFSLRRIMTEDDTPINGLEELSPLQHLQAWKIQEHHYRRPKKLPHSNEIPAYYSCTGMAGKRQEPKRRMLGEPIQAGDPLNAFLPSGFPMNCTRSLVWDGREWHAGLDVRANGRREDAPAFYKTWTPNDVNDDESEDYETDESISTIITGEAISMAPAYSSYVHTQMPPGSTMFGTIRKWDGMVTLRVQSRNSTDGHLIYRGYLMGNGNGGDGNWVGRWRDGGSDVRVVGYEGSFAMSRRR